jgi:hypothetical protein
MNDSQLLIKIILIVVIAIFAIILLLPERGSRRTAIRRIALVLLFVALAGGVASPGVVDQVAKILGVGRGTDLLLYALFVVFIAQAIAMSRRNRQLEKQITVLARRKAIDAEHTRKAFAARGIE